jgi:hypothetical protein
MKKWLKRPTENFALEGEQGQAIVIIAFAIIGLILFAGLALDAATIYAGQTRLKRAVDAAALAAVRDLPSVSLATERTRQFMRANGFDPDNTEMLPVLEARRPTSAYVQWVVTATYRLPLLFLPLINFDYVEITEVAVAEFRSMSNIYTSQRGVRGLAGPVYLGIWGRYANPKYGDPFTPQCWTCNSGCDAEDAGKDFCPNGENPDHGELYSQFGQGYPFMIYIPPSYAEDTIQIEILDPDGYNQPPQGSVTITSSDGSTTTVADCADRRDACLLDTGELANPYWFMRMDRNRYFGTSEGGRPPGGYDKGLNTQTEYRLYYYKRLPSQAIVREDIGLPYIGYARDNDDLADDGKSTDMQWVVAWTLDINCGDGSCDVPDIVVDDNGGRSLRLEVDGVTGFSENGFDLWAGPPPTTTIASDVNLRNLYLISNTLAHDSYGVVTYGSGYLPLSVHTSEPITLTFDFIPPEAVNVAMKIFHFDNDSGGQIDYYLEGVPGWHSVGSLSLDGTWSDSQNYVYQLPGSRNHDSVTMPDVFFGGYLRGILQGDLSDTSTWIVEYEAAMGDTFVRLVE